MAKIEAFAKQDPQTGKWGYAYSYKVEGKSIGGAGQSEYIYDTQGEAETAIANLGQELNVQIAKQLEEASKNSIMRIALFVLALVAAAYFSYKMVYPMGIEFGETAVKSLSGQTPLKSELVSSDRIFKVDGMEYICHNYADFNYTTKMCYFDNVSALAEAPR